MLWIIYVKKCEQKVQVKEGILPKKDIIQITNYITQLIE